MSEAARPTNRSSEEMEMRALIVPEMRRRWPDARIIHELPTRYSTNRIDLAAVTETRIVTVEIKSSRDVLTRLEKQLMAFHSVSSLMVVALAPAWLDDAVHAAQIAGLVRKTGYSFTETWKVCVATGSIENDGWSRGTRQPWAAHMLDMLHVTELHCVGGIHGIGVGPRAVHKHLVTRLADALTGRQVTRSVCAALRARRGFAAGTDDPIISDQIMSQRLAMGIVPALALAQVA